MAKAFTFAIIILQTLSNSQKVSGLFRPLSEWKSEIKSTNATMMVYGQELFGKTLDRTLLASCVGYPGGLQQECDVQYDQDGKPYASRGSAVEMWDAVETYTGIRVRLNTVAEDWGGIDHLDNTMTGYLASKESDVTLNAMADCCQREMFHDYTLPVMERDYTLAFEQPNMAQDIFFRQFALSLWVYLAAFTVFLGVTIHLVISYNRREEDNMSWKDSLEWMFCTLIECIDDYVLM